MTERDREKDRSEKKQKEREGVSQKRNHEGE